MICLCEGCCIAKEAGLLLDTFSLFDWLPRRQILCHRMSIVHSWEAVREVIRSVVINDETEYYTRHGILNWNHLDTIVKVVTTLHCCFFQLTSPPPLPAYNPCKNGN